MKKCVIVTGMHRSGTSVCTAAIHTLGYSLGDIGDYKDEENPKGYFENFDIVALNDEILNEAASSWYSLTDNVWDLLDEAKREIYVGKAINLISSYFVNSNEIVIKDPRISLLMPLWKAATEHFEDLSVSYVVLYRDPYEVAISQERRKEHNADFFLLGKEHLYTKLLWLNYYKEFFYNVGDNRVTLISHRDLLSNPKNILDKLQSFLATEAKNEEVDSFLANVFSRELYRSKNSNEANDDFFKQIYNGLDDFNNRVLVDNSQLLNLVARPVDFSKLSRVTPMIVEIVEQLIKAKMSNSQLDEITQLKTENLELTRLLAESRAAFSTVEKEYCIARTLLDEEREKHRATDTALGYSLSKIKAYENARQAYREVEEGLDKVLLDVNSNSGN